MSTVRNAKRAGLEAMTIFPVKCSTGSGRGDAEAPPTRVATASALNAALYVLM
jgi:hypothetical protein